MREFKNKTVLITGGSSGIGLSAAEAFMRLGASVHIISRNGARLKQAEVDLKHKAGDLITTHRGDVSNYTTIRSIVKSIESKSPIDLLINSAGVVRPGRAVELPLNTYTRAISINLMGTVHTVKAVLPFMISRKSGTILNIGSLAGIVGVYGYTAYSASKFAVHGYTQVLRAEMKPHGIRVCLLCPPDTDTPMLAEERKQQPAETAAINESAGTLSADSVVKSMIAGLKSKRYLIVPGLEGKFVALSSRFIPGIVDAVMDSKIKKVGRRARSQ